MRAVINTRTLPSKACFVFRKTIIEMQGTCVDDCSHENKASLERHGMCVDDCSHENKPTTEVRAWGSTANCSYVSWHCCGTACPLQCTVAVPHI